MDEFIIKIVKSGKSRIFIIVIALLLAALSYYVFGARKRTKAVFPVDEVSSVNEIVKLNYEIPLVKINVSKFRVAKTKVKKTIVEDSSMINFYRQAYSKTGEFDYNDEGEEDENDVSGGYIKNVKSQYPSKVILSR